MNEKIILGQLLDLTDDPALIGDKAVRFMADGALHIKDGKIFARGTAKEILAKNEQLPVEDHRGKFIVPGFIDTHVHYPQTEMIAAYGEQLLTWLTEHAFPAEEKFIDKAYGKKIADIFLNQLLNNGTTTALVFGTVHPQSVDAFFEAAQAKGLRMICGKVMMDRNCPDSLQDEAELSYHQSKDLIERWHGVDRLSYAVTPRFAPTSTPEQLAYAARLLKEYPDLYMHTHVSENLDECAWVKELFPESEDYVGVYEQAGLLKKRAVLAHGIHLSNREMACCAQHDTAVAHCPTSNLFIGSGLINLTALRAHGVCVSLGTDVGGGSSFSMLQSYNEAYKIQQLQNKKLSAFEGLYLATLAGARALDLEGTIGQLSIGCEADLAILDPNATDFLAFRCAQAQDLHQKLFALMMLGDDRAVCATYIQGERYQSPLPTEE